jgi:hypothetical protein
MSGRVERPTGDEQVEEHKLCERPGCRFSKLPTGHCVTDYEKWPCRLALLAERRRLLDEVEAGRERVTQLEQAAAGLASLRAAHVERYGPNLEGRTGVLVDGAVWDAAIRGTGQ